MSCKCISMFVFRLTKLSSRLNTGLTVGGGVGGGASSKSSKYCIGVCINLIALSQFGWALAATFILST